MKAIILTTLLTNDPIIVAMPQTQIVKVEARKRNKGNRDRRRGGRGLR